MKELIRYLKYKTVGTTSFVRRIEWRTILEYLNPKEGERILDIACGCGELSFKIAEHGCEIYGIDISVNSIEHAKRFVELEIIAVEFKVGDAENLPYPDGCFDKIVCSSSLEHFRDDITALKEMHRVLKSNGSIVLSVDSFTYPISNELKEMHRAFAHVVNYYTRETLKEKFDVAGFEMCRSEYLLNSYITSLLFNFGIKMRWSGAVWVMVSIFAYPVCRISDRLFGVKDKGYTLIAEGKSIISLEEENNLLKTRESTNKDTKYMSKCFY